MNNKNSNFWEEGGNSAMQPVKYESCNSNDEQPRSKDDTSLYRFCDGNLNFATVACSEDDSEYGHFHKKNKVSRQDPMSHRIIEKRRRDRMNNCLADLSRLIPADYLKKGRGRIEKTEIIEMAIKHMKYLQQTHHSQSINTEHYRLGFQECMSETMRFLVEVEGFFAREALCVKLINHLQAHCEAVLTSDRVHLNNPINRQTTNVSNNLNLTSSLSSSTTVPISANNTIPIKASQICSPVTNGQMHSDNIHSGGGGVGYEHNLRDILSTQAIKEQNLQQIIHSTTTENMIDNGVTTSSKQLHNTEPIYLRNQSQMHEYQRRDDTVSRNSSDGVQYMTKRNSMESERGGNTTGSTSVSLYKFKNSIIDRISQETVSSSFFSHNINKLYKRRKMEMHDHNHRSSASTGGSTSSGHNHSEHYYSENSPTDVSEQSPPGSDAFTRISTESDHLNRISPTGSSVSDIHKTDHQNSSPKQRYLAKSRHHQTRDIIKNNISTKLNANNQLNNGQCVSPVSDNKLHIKNVNGKNEDVNNFSVPIFVLHTKGSFYIPLTIDYNTLVPYLQNYNILDLIPNLHNIVLHPVTINVNFQPNSIVNLCQKQHQKYKTEVENGWH